MEWYHALIYGIVQGLTEFLPVSSSCHLALLPILLKISDPGVYFDLMMHLGTTFAIVTYFFKDIWKLLRDFKHWRTAGEGRLLKNLAIATVCCVVFVAAFKHSSEVYGRSLPAMIFNLVFFGVVLYLVDMRASRLKQELPVSHFTWKQSLAIGFAQAFAIFPGVSRSGITIATARYFRLSRTDATQFSFFLAIPIILAGALLKTVEILSLITVEPERLQTIPWGAMLIGMLVSFAVGLVTIHYFLKFIRKVDFLYFLIYRILLAGAIAFFM